MKLVNSLFLCVLAATAIGLSTLPSGGQEANYSAPARPRAVVAPPGTPVPPASPVLAPVLGAVIPGGDFALVAPGHVVDPADAEARDLRKQDHDLDGATKQLLGQLRSAESAGDRSPILEQLSETVEKHFEVRQQIRERELEALEARVKKLRELHDKREDAKNDIVRQRVEELVRNADGLGWGGGSTEAAPGGLLNTPVGARVYYGQ